MGEARAPGPTPWKFRRALAASWTTKGEILRARAIRKHRGVQARISRLEHLGLLSAKGAARFRQTPPSLNEIVLGLISCDNGGAGEVSGAGKSPEGGFVSCVWCAVTTGSVGGRCALCVRSCFDSVRSLSTAVRCTSL